MNKELYYCKGSSENPQGVIKVLEEKGGINADNLAGDSSNSYYYLVGNNAIIYSPCSSDVARVLMEYGTKLRPKSKLPSSWKEFCEIYNVSKEWYIDDTSSINKTSKGFRDSNADRNLFSTKQEAEAFLALIQLRRLREVWIGTWKFEFNKPVAYIYNCQGKVIVDDCGGVCGNMILSFPNIEMAGKFLKCFKDLLEKARILL